MEDVIEKAEEAITEVFNDRSATQMETKERLSELAEFIQDMLNTLPG